MKHLLFGLVLAVALSSSASAQLVNPDKAKKSEEIAKKMRQLDLLNHILPLALKKEQIRELLPAIERCRQKVKTVQEKEHELLVKIEAKVNAAVNKGVENGDVPDKELLKEVNALLSGLSIIRQAAIGENLELMSPVLKKVLNAGQLKVAQNSLSTAIYFPGRKPEEITDEMKLNMFIQDILLDPQAYEILDRMSRGQRG